MSAALESPLRRRVVRAALAAPWLGGLPALAAPAQGLGAVQPFALAAVRLTPGVFLSAQELGGRYLLSLEPDRLLHNFRVNAGLRPKAPVYGGWESQEPWVDIRCHGHTLGHYLSACSMMAASTAKPEYRRRVDTIVAELGACQAAAGHGLVCAFPDGDLQLRNSLAGRPVTGVPWYTMHKILAGLRDAHTLACSAQALAVLHRLVVWIEEAAQGCDDARFQQMLGIEHGGMNEVLADLHAISGDSRHLALARRFDHHALLDPLAEGRDPLDGWHANTQIPKVIGFARLHALTGEARYGRAAHYFWGSVVGRRSFATGGNGDVEHFFPVDEVRQHLGSAKTMETCSTHNMLRLTRALFLEQPTATFGDYYERALINGILASQDPSSGMVTYFQATRPGYPKLYGTPTRSFWCCTGTGMENHAKYGDSIYFHDDRALVVNLYIASVLHWAERGLRVRQLTNFPEQDSTRLLVQEAPRTRMAIRLRHPGWCRQATVLVNGRRHTESREPGSYIEIERTWRRGDEVVMQLPMHLHLQPLPAAPDVAALMFGPLVLAARMGTQGMQPGDDVIVNERESGQMLQLPMDMPRLDLRGQALEQRVRRREGRPLSFTVDASAPARALELVPFHRIAHERYNLYWQVS